MTRDKVLISVLRSAGSSLFDIAREKIRNFFFSPSALYGH